MSELARRVLFAVAAIPVAVGAIWVGGAPFVALLAILAALGAGELFRIARARGVAPLETLGIPLAGLLPIAVVAAHRGLLGNLPTWIAVSVLAVLGASIWARGVAGGPLAAVAVTVFGVLYTGGMLSFGYAIRYHPYAVGRAAGTALVLFPLVLTWTSDTGAFFAGRTFGRRKLIPAVSPAKTVEGALGGLLLSMLVAWVYAAFVLAPYARLGMRPYLALAFGAAVSAAAQIGDLAESLIKREAGVKDSSRLLPGHGGILDRFDSLFFVLPIAYLLLGPMLIPIP